MPGNNPYPFRNYTPGSGLSTNYQLGQANQTLTNQVNNTDVPDVNAGSTSNASPSPNNSGSYGNLMSDIKGFDPTGGQGGGQGAGQDAMSYGDALKQNAPNLLLGAAQTAVGLGGLMSQGDIPQYQQPDRLQDAYQEYGQIAEQGYPEVLAGTEQRMQRSMNTARQESMDQAGPSTANAINAAFQSQALEANRKLGEMERQQKMKGLQQQAQMAQALRQDELQRKQAARRRYGQEEAAFGKAAQSGMSNMTNAFNLATGIANVAAGNPMGAVQGGNALMGIIGGQNNK